MEDLAHWNQSFESLKFINSNFEIQEDAIWVGYCLNESLRDHESLVTPLSYLTWHLLYICHLVSTALHCFCYLFLEILRVEIMSYLCVTCA